MADPFALTLTGPLVDLGPVPDWLVIDAIRYAQGRMTYQVSSTVNWCIAVWPRLPAHLRQQIRRDLEREVERDDFVRARGGDGPMPLGMSCDRADWDRLLAVARADPGAAA